MDALFNCLRAEEHPGVRAVLGHYIFVFIHPFPDGNGRIARFLMNAMLASGGYPWTVIRVSRRRAYIGALEHVHMHQDIAPFARFIGEEMSAMKDAGG
jgi:Fic family protein